MSKNLNNPEFIDKILNLPIEERNKIRFGNLYGVKRTKKINKKRRIKNPTKEMMIEYLKIHKIKTQRQLFERSHRGEPSIYLYKKIFGSWIKALKETWGQDFPAAQKVFIKEKERGVVVPPRYNENKDIDNYLIGILVEFNIWTEYKYRKYRKERPELFPSFHVINRRWGNFKRLAYIAKKKSLNKSVEEYINLHKRLNRFPTITECKKYNLDKIFDLIEVYGSKKKMDVFISQIMKKGMKI